jgi:hypothetical protein
MMGAFVVLLLAVLGYAVWSGKVKLAQVPAILLTLGGVMIALRGGWMIGIPAALIGISWYRGLLSRMFSRKSLQKDDAELGKARTLLGVTTGDDADRIRARHRQLISENHPDRGGRDAHASELNKARDVLLDDLTQRDGG